MRAMIVVVVILTCIPAMPVVAATFSAGTGSGGCGAPLAVSDPIEAIATGTSSPTAGGNGSAAMVATASAGGVTGVVDGYLDGIGLGGANITQMGTCESALMTLDDVVITGPASTVVTSFSGHLTGTHTQATSSSGIVNHSVVVEFTNSATSVHPFVGGASDVILTSPETTRTTGQAFTVSIQINVENVASVRGGVPAGTAEFHSDYRARLPVGIPVFNLPAGFTANSADGRIVDNLYQPPPVVGAEVGAPGSDGLRLAPAAPNPMRSITTIVFELPRGAGADLAVYDVRGRRVRSLVNGWRTVGRHEVRWDGRSESGQPVSAGLYLYRLTASGRTLTGKIVRRGY